MVAREAIELEVLGMRLLGPIGIALVAAVIAVTSHEGGGAAAAGASPSAGESRPCDAGAARQ
ncbi:MAG: hypothetical protein M3Q92_10895, partial [Actinomycetota bacterium]|nr:hypothetical protein [Actinomycetota bacterium]